MDGDRLRARSAGPPWPDPDLLDQRRAAHLARFQVDLAPRLPAGEPNLRDWRPFIRGLSAGDAATLAVSLLDGGGTWLAAKVMPTLARRNLDSDATDAALMLDGLQRRISWMIIPALAGVTTYLERLDQPDLANLRPRIWAALVALDDVEGLPTQRAAVRARLAALLPAAGDLPAVRPFAHAIKETDGWGEWACDMLARDRRRDPAAIALLAHLAMPISSPIPSKRWRTETAELLACIPDGPAMVHSLLRGAIECPTGGHTFRVADDNGDIVRGLIWAAATIDAPWLVNVLCGIIEHDRLSRLVVDRKLINAAYNVLGSSSDPAAKVTLRRRRGVESDRGYRRLIEKALQEDTPPLRAVN